MFHVKCQTLRIRPSKVQLFSSSRFSFSRTGFDMAPNMVSPVGPNLGTKWCFFQRKTGAVLSGMVGQPMLPMQQFVLMPAPVMWDGNQFAPSGKELEEMLKQVG